MVGFPLLHLKHKETGAAATAEPLTLHDGEGNILALRFDCARCEMAVILQEKKKG